MGCCARSCCIEIGAGGVCRIWLSANFWRVAVHFWLVDEVSAGGSEQARATRSWELSWMDVVLDQ